MKDQLAKRTREQREEYYKKCNYTDLMIAISEQDYDKMALLLQQKSKEYVCRIPRDGTRSCAVIEAIGNDDFRALQLLLASGKAEFSSLYSADKYEDEEEYEEEYEERTPLHFMTDYTAECNDKDFEMIRWLIEIAKVDVNATGNTSSGYTVLGSVAHDENLKVMRLLMKNGAKINMREYGANHITILMDCVIEGKEKSVQYFCSLPEFRDKIHFNLCDKEGNTALHHAILYPSVFSVEQLMSTGKCKLHIQNADKKTVLDLADEITDENVKCQITSLLKPDVNHRRKKQKI